MNSIKGIDLRHLRYFVAVAEQRSFSKAAALLHMAQPPLSQQIMDLEARIGAPLFVRDKRHVMLSEAGRTLLPDAQAVIGQTQAAVQRVQRVSRGLTGRLRVGMMSTAPHNPHIMGLLRRFARRYPGVEIDLVTMSSLMQRSALADDALDLGFHWAWGTRPERGMITHLLPAHRFMLALPLEHPLAQKKSVAPKDLQDMTWFVTGAQHNRAWQQFTLNLFQSLRFTPARLIEKNPVPMILASVAAGQGVSLVPDFMAAAFPDVRYVPLPKIPGLSPEINVCLTKKKLHQDGLIAHLYNMAVA